MNKIRLSLSLWIMLALLSACAPGKGQATASGTSAVTNTDIPPSTGTLPPTAPAAMDTPIPTPTASQQTGVTLPAPTPLPGSTPVPWWGPTLHTLDIEPKYFKKPTGIRVAPDGSLYVADGGYHRILHLDPEGKVLQVWGTYSETVDGETAPSGTFNEPWGLTLGPDGSIYVADTWHHRVQKFTADGQFVLAWGEWGQGNDPYRFWGPRDLAVDSQGHVFVTDGGNKRVVVYNQDGKYLSQIGGAGDRPGQFDEPIGLALDPGGNLYVADQGNRRVQVFSVAGDGSLAPKAAWPVEAWNTNSLDFKPFICLSGGHVFLTDPETGSVQEYSLEGERLQTYNINTTGYLNPGILYGISSDPAGGLWVSDSIGGVGVLVKIFPLGG